MLRDAISLLLLLAAAWLFEWNDTYHLGVGVLTLGALAGVRRVLRSIRHHSALDEVGPSSPDDERASILPFVWASAQGVCIVFLLALTYSILGTTTFYARLGDVEGRSLLRASGELRNARDWNGIIGLLSFPLPSSIANANLRSLLERKYEATANQISAIDDVGAQCRLAANGKDLAQHNGFDSSGLDPIVKRCDRISSRRTLPPRSHGDVVRLQSASGQVRAEILVKDPSGKLIRNLQPADFWTDMDTDTTLVKNVNFTGAPTSAQYFVVALDSSGSMAKFLSEAKTGVQYIVAGLGEADWSALVLCTSPPTPIVPATHEHLRLLRALAAVQPAGETAIYDGVWSALDQIEKLSGRVLLITDGGDTRSVRTARSLIQRAATERTPIDVIAVNTVGPGYAELREIALSSGGQFDEAKNGEEMARIFVGLRRRVVPEDRYVVTLDVGTAHGPIALLIGGENAVRLPLIVPQGKAMQP